MTRLALLGALLLGSVSAFGTSITYTLTGSGDLTFIDMQFTAPTWYPDVPDIPSMYSMPRGAMRYCNGCSSGLNVTFTGFNFWTMPNGNVRVLAAFDDNVAGIRLREIESTYTPEQLRTPGVYTSRIDSTAIVNTLTVAANNDPVTFAPEPSTVGLYAAAVGLFAVGVARKAKRRTSV